MMTLLIIIVLTTLLVTATYPQGTVLIGFAVVIASAASLLYLIRIYRRQIQPRSIIFRSVVGIGSAAVTVGAYFVALTAYRAVNESVPDWTVPFSAAAIVSLLSTPIYYAFLVWKIRREGADVSISRDDTV